VTLATAVYFANIELSNVTLGMILSDSLIFSKSSCLKLKSKLYAQSKIDGLQVHGIFKSYADYSPLK